MKDDLEPLDPELSELLAIARQRDGRDASFDDEACERLLRRVEREIGAGSAAASTTAFGLPFGGSGAIAAACAALAIAAAIAATRATDEAPIAPSPVVEPAPSSAPAPERTPPLENAADEPSPRATVSVDELPSPAPRPTASAARVAKPETGKNVDERPKKLDGDPPANLAAELQLVDEARAAIADGRHAEALRVLDEHDARFPSGQLAQQRERLRIQALVATGDEPQARIRAAKFRQRHPSGLLLPAVERALEGGHADAP